MYPRSFVDSNGDGIGDLPGVVSRLDHLVDLGVRALWLSPFFRSPQRDFGYDITDYRDVAPEYGTLEDAQRLIDEAHRRGLAVIFDLVLNHTSDQHPWFVESRASRTNPRADWYVWAEGSRDRRGRPVPPNNWRSELQLPRAWQWSNERRQWYLASFLPFQPDLNWRNPSVRAEMFDMVRMWLGRGVDGFRLDIFGSCMQDPALRDNDPWPTLYAGMPRLQTPNRTLNTEDRPSGSTATRFGVRCNGPRTPTPASAPRGSRPGCRRTTTTRSATQRPRPATLLRCSPGTAPSSRSAPNERRCGRADLSSRRTRRVT